MKSWCLVLLFIAVTLTGFAQSSDSIYVQITNTYPKTITKKVLSSAHALKDINPGYPSSWIKGYEAVDLAISSVEGEQVASGMSEELTKEQLALLAHTQVGDKVELRIRYYNQDLKASSESREIKFSYYVVPHIEASFYRKDDSDKKAVDAYFKAPLSELRNFSFELCIVEFVIDKEGSVTDIKLTVSSGIETVDTLLIKALESMPEWRAAEDEQGRKIPQIFELRAGNMLGC